MTKKNMAKALGLMLLVLGLGAPRLHAAALQDIMTEWYGSNALSETVRASSSTCVNLAYSGASTEAIVTITSQSITAYAPFGTADTNFGTSGSYHFDTTTTMGALCDGINGDTNYSCLLRGCKRTDLPKYLREQTATTGTNDLKTAGGFSVLMDSGTYGNRAGATLNMRIGIIPQSGRRVVLTKCIANANVIGTLKVYGVLKKFSSGLDTFGAAVNDSTEVWSSATADDTDLTMPSTIPPRNGWLEFGNDEHVVISAGDTTGTQVGANFLSCHWEEQ